MLLEKTLFLGMPLLESIWESLSCLLFTSVLLLVFLGTKTSKHPSPHPTALLHTDYSFCQLHLEALFNHTGPIASNQQNAENTNITLHVMCLSSQGTIWATPLLDAASGLLLPSSPSNTYLGLHPGSGNQVSPKLTVGIHKIYIELILEVSTSSKVC